jgi:AraC-like DNA-binding protein
MTILKAVKQSLDYIEANLTNDISVWHVANAVSFSQFYFSRQFSLYTHISIYEYVLKRKLSESYKHMFSEKPKIIELAFKYGFASHEVYTRAFRKMFGENPSEVCDYKPLLVYEPINDDYLGFLNGLKAEIMNDQIVECYFNINSIADYDTTHNLLILLSGKHRLSINCLLQGDLITEKMNILSFKLDNLKLKLRIYHHDTKNAIRYFFDNFYEPAKMTSNFILVKKDHNSIDFIISEK